MSQTDRFDEGYKTDTYGELIADVYDQHYTGLPPVDPMVDFLAELAGQGPALELGIGTGRVALPLANRGVEVHGIDASQRMVDRLRAKPGGEGISVNIGDFEKVESPGSIYALVFVIWNTFYALENQDAQIRCMENVRQRLDANGKFVLSGFVPDLEMYKRGQYAQVDELGIDDVRLEVATLDPVNQVVRAMDVVIADGETHTYPTRLRYCWPSELDLMAKVAGLTLESRWADWDRSEFNSNSRTSISVYKRS